MNAKSTPKPVKRLETMLRIWEDTLLLTQASLTAGMGPVKKENLFGSTLNWSSLRKELLLRKPISVESFETPLDVMKFYFMGSSVMCELPFLLQLWCMSSRRIYTLSEDFQRSLELTSIGKISWQDVTSPFPVFGITLSIPVTWEFEGNNGTIDFILVDFSDTKVSITALGSDLNGRQFFSPEKRHRIMKAIRNHELGTIRAIIHGLKQEDFAMPATHQVVLPMSNAPIADDFDTTEFNTLLAGELTLALSNNRKLPDFWRLLIRLVAGLCLHLEVSSKTDSDIIITPWKRCEPNLSSTPDNRAITDESMVCAVNLASPLNLEEKEYHSRIRKVGIESATRELPAHFRKTYWRRGPGTGNDPLAPKWVKVRWTWVNKHRLPENALPAGSEVPIK